MKDKNNGNDAVLSRFGRDRRHATDEAAPVRERRPRMEHGVYNRVERPARRASYNPNFTADNRPVGEEAAPRRESHRNFGDNRRNNSYGDRPARRPSNNRFASSDSESYPRGERRPYGEHKPSFGEHRSSFGDRPARPARRPFERDNDAPSASQHDTRRKAGGRFGAKNNDSRRREDGAHRRFGKPSAPKSYPRFDAPQMGEIRLNRFIAQSGLCSRREADEFIAAGLVSVNGTIVTELGTKVLPTDEVKFNDSRIQGEKKVYLVLNKPKGYVTTVEDDHAAKTVMELVSGACTERIYPVGRLDKNSVGLLLFTNDGDLVKQLTHPSFEKKKVYQVSLDKPLTKADMETLAEGIELEDGEIYADEIAYADESRKEVGVEIHSGRNRIVRRMFEHLGYHVEKLDRVYYAGITKKNLKRGEWRFLTKDEVARLKSGRYE